jgi:hypothetical protein
MEYYLHTSLCANALLMAQGLNVGRATPYLQSVTLCTEKTWFTVTWLLAPYSKTSLEIPDGLVIVQQWLSVLCPLASMISLYVSKMKMNKKCLEKSSLVSFTNDIYYRGVHILRNLRSFPVTRTYKVSKDNWISLSKKRTRCTYAFFFIV